MNEPHYEVWLSLGTDRCPGPSFERLRDALAYVELHAGCFQIRLPNGKWLPIDNLDDLGANAATPV
jgi:hypothetical protein